VWYVPEMRANELSYMFLKQEGVRKSFARDRKLELMSSSRQQVKCSTIAIAQLSANENIQKNQLQGNWLVEEFALLHQNLKIFHTIFFARPIAGLNNQPTAVAISDFFLPVFPYGTDPL